MRSRAVNQPADASRLGFSDPWRDVPIYLDALSTGIVEPPLGIVDECDAHFRDAGLVDHSAMSRPGVRNWETTVKKPPPPIITGASCRRQANKSCRRQANKETLGSSCRRRATLNNVFSMSLSRTAARRAAQRSAVPGELASIAGAPFTDPAANDNESLPERHVA